MRKSGRQRVRIGSAAFCSLWGSMNRADNVVRCDDAADEGPDLSYERDVHPGLLGGFRRRFHRLLHRDHGVMSLLSVDN